LVSDLMKLNSVELVRVEGYVKGVVDSKPKARETATEGDKQSKQAAG